MASRTEPVPFNYMSARDTFQRVRDHTWNLFLSHAHRVEAPTWQGSDVSRRPEMVSYELMNYTFTHKLRGIEDLQHYRDDIKPNLPWADDHFNERVCGKPINPGVEWANWPWGSNAEKFLDATGKFNHNYMERYWPKYAGNLPRPTQTAEEWKQEASEYGLTPELDYQCGIRNPYGDLDDLVYSLARNPLSRQEWFPIFYPEDVGEVAGGRKPCSLGYQFWVRGNELHIYYPLRSCDFFRHMQDDIYLTIRLMLWVLDQCRDCCQNHPDIGDWDSIVPGTFTMHCTSLHVFANDMVAMQQEGPR